MKMITVNGLTDRQKTLADLLWSCASIEQVHDLIQALPTRQDQYDAASLVRVLAWETLESEGGLDAHADAAHSAISRARR